jgi:hypothetical protein
MLPAAAVSAAVDEKLLSDRSMLLCCFQSIVEEKCGRGRQAVSNFYGNIMLGKVEICCYVANPRTIR